MKNLGLILFPLDFLLGFCFTNLDLSNIQLKTADFSLITSFVIITFLEPILLVCFLKLNVLYR